MKSCKIESRKSVKSVPFFQNEREKEWILQWSFLNLASARKVIDVRKSSSSGARRSLPGQSARRYILSRLIGAEDQSAATVTRGKPVFVIPR